MNAKQSAVARVRRIAEKRKGVRYMQAMIREYRSRPGMAAMWWRGRVMVGAVNETNGTVQLSREVHRLAPPVGKTIIKLSRGEQ